MKFRVCQGAALLSMILLARGVAQENSPQSEKPQRPAADQFEDYIRIRKDAKDRPRSLETSITRFEGKTPDGKPYFVDLIGVVHVGEAEYYETLNAHFDQYEAVLYELVAPKGTRIPKGGRMDEGLNPIAAIQKGMQTMLDLDFQLDHIDYTQEKLIHADMSPEEFLEKMAENEESFGKFFLRAVGQSFAQQNTGQLNEADLLLSLFSEDPTIEMRRIMARQMKDIEGGMMIFRGKNGSTIITHRNHKALEVLREQLAEGKTRLAIFYGAGHMPEMEHQLTEQFQTVRAGRFWLEAWNLKER